MHFLSLRLDKHAQLEIRAFAEAMATFTRAWVPLCWEAFTDYRLESVQLSRIELKVLGRMLAGEPEARALESSGLKARERRELVAKLATIRAAADPASAP